MGKLKKTFQGRLVFYNLAIVICIALAISIYNYRSYRSDTINTAQSHSYNQIVTLAERLDVAYNELVHILINCAERKSTVFSSTAISSVSETDAKYSLFASEALRDLCAVSGYSSYIYKLTIFQSNGFTLQAGSSVGNTDDITQIMSAPWFEDYLTQSTSQYSLKLTDNPFSFSRKANPKLLPMLRPLKYSGNLAPKDAWVFLAISPKLYEDSLHNLSARHVFAATQTGELIAAKGVDDFPVEELAQMLLAEKESCGSFRRCISGESCIVSFHKELYSGLLLFEILPISELNIDHHIIFNTILIVFLFCIVIGLTLSLLVSHQLIAPINRLIERLKLIADGNFERDPTIETEDEIGVIGKQINSMSGRINELLESRVQSEHEKKDLEIKMLQAQINPHFLYNTLDSIKWIATMQKNTGIVQVVTALSSLLKNMAKGFNEKVTLRQELEFLDNYVTIERIRYIELFDLEVSVDDPALYEAKIIKLTLQPLVENAIFSGIEPSGRFGLIQIHAYAKEQTLYIRVTDNGIGIASEQIESLLSDTSRVTKSRMSGIGLPNVARRIKLVYGEEYGLTVESKEDCYTTITIALPLEY